MMRNRFLFILTIIVATSLLLFGVGHGLLRHIVGASGTNSQTEYLIIEPGTSVNSVAVQAVELGMVTKAWHFKLVVRWRGLDRSLYAGEYVVPAHAALADVLTTIEKQDTFKRRFIVPEGASVADIEALLIETFGLLSSGYIRPAEGSLLPETYYYERGDTAADLIGRMQEALQEEFDKLWRVRASDLPFTDQQQALVLASIVEKETGVASERSLVAAVFINRLKKNMRLQSDPTVIYGISAGAPLERALTRRDLRTDTPYNSYRRSGLPPTPITNPGRAAIAAVLNPANVPYLYFVADGTGGHAFAETLDEHNKNVARWRLIEKRHHRR